MMKLVCLALVFAAVCLHTTEAINCYSSKTVDTETFDESKVTKVPCATNYCVKIKQKAASVESWTRMCSTKAACDAYDGTKNAAGYEIKCWGCDTDKCNSVSSVTATKLAILLPAALFIFFLKKML